jgi:hypothetical protein
MKPTPVAAGQAHPLAMAGAQRLAGSVIGHVRVIDTLTVIVVNRPDLPIPTR